MQQQMEVFKDVSGFVVSNALTHKTCRDLIAKAEEAGFVAPSKKAVFAGNRERATFTDEDLAQSLWEKLASCCRPHAHDASVSNHTFDGPSVASGLYEPIGINPFMRISKYTPGQSFKAHTDAAYSCGQQYVAMDTLLLYLNDDLEGGETVVYGKDNSWVVTPDPGRVLVFYHHTLHEGAKVTGGVKYVLRTEVMYKKVKKLKSKKKN